MPVSYFGSEAIDEAMGWLGDGLGPSPPPYLRLLNHGTDELSRRVYANLEAVTDRLRDRPELWGAMVRVPNWRPTLVGCAAVLLSRDARFFDDMIWRFREGSWVAPQVAVALGIVHRDETVPALEAMIRDPIPSPWQIKTLFSAYAALKILGRDAVQEFEAGDLFRRTLPEFGEGWWPGTYHGRIAVNVVRWNWQQWMSRGPYGVVVRRSDDRATLPIE